MATADVTHPIIDYICRNMHTAIRPLAEVQKEVICTAMIWAKGDIDVAAKQLKISRATLYRRLTQYRKAECAIRS